MTWIRYRRTGWTESQMYFVQDKTYCSKR